MITLYGIWMERKDTHGCWLSSYDGLVFCTNHIGRAHAQLLTVMSGKEFPIKDGDGNIVTGLRVVEIGEDGRPVGDD